MHLFTLDICILMHFFTLVASIFYHIEVLLQLSKEVFFFIFIKVSEFINILNT